MGSTHRAERPAGLAPGRFVTIAEAATRHGARRSKRGIPKANAYGHAFVYPGR